MRQRDTRIVLTAAQTGWRGIDNGHGREVFRLVVGRVVVVGVVEGHSRRGFGGSPLGHVDDESFGDILPAWKVSVQRPAHFLFRPQSAVLALLRISRDDSQSDVWGIEAPAERIGVLLEDHLADVVNQVILADLDQRGRRIRALDPYLAVQHGGAEVDGSSAEIVVGRRRAAGEGSGGQVGREQRLDHLGISRGDDRLAADQGGLGGARGRGVAGGGEGRGLVAVAGRGRGRRERGGGRDGDGGVDGRGLLEGQLGAGLGDVDGRGRALAGGGGGVVAGGPGVLGETRRRA